MMRLPSENLRKAASTMMVIIIVWAALAGALVVVGIGVAIFSSGVGAARSTEAKTMSQNNLKQLSLAIHGFHDNKGNFPPAWSQTGTVEPYSRYKGPVSNQTGTIHFHLMPYLELGNTYNMAGGSSQTIATESVRVFQSPGDESMPRGGAGATSYLANYQAFGRGDSGWANKASFTTISDGTSNTIAFAESSAVNGSVVVRWAGVMDPGLAPQQPSAAPAGNLPMMPVFAVYGGPKKGVQVAPNSHLDGPMKVTGSAGAMPNRAHALWSSGALVGLMDGSVRAIDKTISTATWWSGCTPDGGEVLGSDW